MDWNNLIADTEDILTVHYSEGRQGHTIDKVIVHYNDGNLSVEDCYRVWQSREASAHYQVEESGRIGQLVWDANTSWNCGKWVPNCESIGVEHANRPDGTISDACLDAGGHLVAAICKKYGLGRPEWLTNVFPHCYFVSTSCPGEIYGSQRDAYIASAQRWYDSTMGTTHAPAPDHTPVPVASLVVDGDCGARTCTEWQSQLGCQVDGEITGQWDGNQRYTRAASCITDWSNVGESDTVMAIQRKLGIGDDGFWGHDTSAAIQSHLNDLGHGLVVDSDFGPKSASALQQSLNAGQWR